MIRLRAIPALLIACAVGAASAAPPAGAPAGTTGLCNDGSYTSTAKRQGACSSHQGVKEWYAGRAKSGASGKGKRAKGTTRAPATAPASSPSSSGSSN